jgi:hypothetical protein
MVLNTTQFESTTALAGANTQGNATSGKERVLMRLPCDSACATPRSEASETKTQWMTSNEAEFPALKDWATPVPGRWVIRAAPRNHGVTIGI